MVQHGWMLYLDIDCITRFSALPLTMNALQSTCTGQLSNSYVLSLEQLTACIKMLYI